MNEPSIAIIIVSRNRPDLVHQSVMQFEQDAYQNKQILVVECGSDLSNLTNYETVYFSDPDFRGKCFGHNVGLNYLNLKNKYDYYLFCMNDVFIQGRRNFLAHMVEAMQVNQEIGILSPTEPHSEYPGAQPKGDGLRTVTTADYLFLFVRGEVLRECGFLNPNFKYCWGAIHELSYKLYSRQWSVVYDDNLSYKHLGGTTYGAAATKTISRDQYIANAKDFARTYFIKNYGYDWDQTFWCTATSSYNIEDNTYSLHKNFWESSAI